MPLLSWFLFFICLLYFWVFSYYLGFFFSALKMRQLFFFKLMSFTISLYIFFWICVINFGMSFYFKIYKFFLYKLL